MLTEKELFNKVEKLFSTEKDFISNLLKNNRMEPIANEEFLIASMLPGHLYLLIWKDPYYDWDTASLKYVVSNDFIQQNYLLDLSKPPNGILVANYQYSQVISLETAGFSRKKLESLHSARGRSSIRRAFSYSKHYNNVMYQFGGYDWVWNAWNDENLVVYDLTSSIFLGIPSLNFPQGVI